MDSGLSKKAKAWLREYIEGEVKDLSEDVRKELLSIADKDSVEVYRGNYFDSREQAQERYKSEDLKKFSYSVKSPKSFSLDQEQAELFAQDINSNYGIVIRLNIEVAHIDLSALSEDITQDFDHEAEILVLEDCVVEATVVKEYSNVKKKLGLS